MNKHERDNLIRNWVRLGCLFGVTPSPETPDIERLLVRTARLIPHNARLLPVVTTWLVVYGDAVARHRLGRLIRGELARGDQPSLGLLLEAAVERGAPTGLRACCQACTPETVGRPLYAFQRDDATLAAIAEKNASALSRRWGVWAPEFDLKRDAIRPVSWVLDRNPDLRDRIIRKGDLRASILESLRWDTPDGSAPSEMALTRLTGATRAGVRAALDALLLAGAVTVGVNPVNDRDHPVRLVAA